MNKPLLVALVCTVSACGAIKGPVQSATNLAQTGSSPMIQSKTVALSPSISLPLEKVVFLGTYASAAYLILDPFAPNWEIVEAKFPDDRFHMSLQMKRVYSGGAGEARAIFHHRARELAKAGEFEGYQVLEYREGIESSVLGSQRVADGVIQLTGKLSE